MTAREGLGAVRLPARLRNGGPARRRSAERSYLAQHAPLLVTTAAAVAYAFVWVVHWSMLDGLGVSVPEVGLDYVAILSRAIPITIFGGAALLLVIATVRAWETQMDYVFSNASVRQWLVFLISTGVVVTVSLALGAGPSGIFPVLAAVAAVVARAVAPSLGRWWRRLRALGRGGILAAAVVGLLVAGSVVGDYWTARLLAGRLRSDFLADLLIVRWPQPVSVFAAGTTEPAVGINQPPEADCPPLYLGTSDGVHVFVEVSDNRHAVVRLPVESVALRTAIVSTADGTAVSRC